MTKRKNLSAGPAWARDGGPLSGPDARFDIQEDPEDRKVYTELENTDTINRSMALAFRSVLTQMDILAGLGDAEDSWDKLNDIVREAHEWYDAAQREEALDD